MKNAEERTNRTLKTTARESENDDKTMQKKLVQKWQKYNCKSNGQKYKTLKNQNSSTVGSFPLFSIVIIQESL